MKITIKQLRQIIREQFENPAPEAQDAINAIGEEIVNLGGHLEYLRDDIKDSKALVVDRFKELFKANPNLAGANFGPAFREMLSSGQVKGILKRVFEKTGSISSAVNALFDEIEKRMDYM